MLISQDFFRYFLVLIWVTACEGLHRLIPAYATFESILSPYIGYLGCWFLTGNLEFRYDITMTVNLDKHRDNLLSAWKDVLDEKTATDWALFGYEGQTNDLKVVSKGSGGIEEMIEDLNSGKIMYAFCRVLDPKTSLPKCVLINWQGEGAPLVRKGTCANHVRDVARFFKGTHLTLNARNEEEVDPQLIIDKVAKSTGSAYSFKERADNDVAHTAPIGTSYKKVVPTQEINSMERDKFWEKEEKEEKQRQEEERKRKEEERLKLEMERRQREITEAELREERAQERNRNINQLREAERSAESNLHSPVSADDELADREREEQERKGRSELLRRQRSQEAHALISQRTIDARAVFEQNTSAGQMHNRRKASVTMGALPEDQPAAIPESVIEKQPSPLANNTDIPHEQLNFSSSEISAGNSKITNLNISPNISQGCRESEITGDPLLQSDDVLLFDPPTLGSDLGLKARALYDYQAADPTEITFDPGDIITHIDQIDEGWWQGLGPDGTFGLFPANYVELIE